MAWCPLSCVTPSWLDSHDWWEWLLSWKKKGLKGLDCRTLVGQAFRLEIQNLIKREASWRRSLHDMWKDDLAMFVCLAVEMNRAWTSTSEQHCVKDACNYNDTHLLKRDYRGVSFNFSLTTTDICQMRTLRGTSSVSQSSTWFLLKSPRHFFMIPSGCTYRHMVTYVQFWKWQVSTCFIHLVCLKTHIFFFNQ